MYSEDDMVPLSALQHFLYCPRQCALIHIEQAWEENRMTTEGRILHERVDLGGAEQRRDTRRVFSLPIHSFRLGLAGKADVVEFRRAGSDRWQPYPVEHKRGRRKREDWDRVQLCAQALCLEETLDDSVPEGALFYGKEPLILTFSPRQCGEKELLGLPTRKEKHSSFSSSLALNRRFGSAPQ